MLSLAMFGVLALVATALILVGLPLFIWLFIKTNKPATPSFPPVFRPSIVSAPKPITPPDNSLIIFLVSAVGVIVAFVLCLVTVPVFYILLFTK